MNGKVTQVLGAVVDVSFPAGALPPIGTALTTTNAVLNARQDNLTLEVAQHLGDNIVRTIALDNTDGLVRGQEVINTRAGLSMPVGEGTLGRALTFWGDPMDEAGPVHAAKRMPIPRRPPAIEERAASQRPFSDRHGK